MNNNLQPHTHAVSIGISLFVIIMFFGLLPNAKAFSAKPAVMTSGGDGENSNYWVLIRNVAVLDCQTNNFIADRDVIVIDNYIHTISLNPIMLFDKDLTINLDGGGRKLIATCPNDPPKTEISHLSDGFTEKTIADIVVVDSVQKDQIFKIMELLEQRDTEQMQNMVEIRVLMLAGEIIKITLPDARIDASRLKAYQENMGRKQILLQ